MECEIPEFYSTQERRSARNRHCCECSAPILKGEQYLLCVGKWDGKFNSYYQHLLCAEACMYIRDHFNDWECIGFGQLFDWGSDDAYGWMPDHKAKPDVQALRNMIAKIRRREHNALPLCRYCKKEMNDEVEWLYGLCSAACAKYEDRARLKF